jgi:hypothetical protein
MNAHLRIARPVSNLAKSVQLYRQGLSLQELGGFENHAGFDGVMLGEPGAQFHLEFTCFRHHPVSAAPTPEDLLVFYVPVREDWEARCLAMQNAGFLEVEPFNPYWKGRGRTFQDEDGYRVVIENSHWHSTARQAD